MEKPRYTVLERLGGGGQAEVFRGISESMQGFKKAVAIKRVLPNLTTNQQFVAMFLDEARLSLFLQHANVVQVFDISKADDGTYFLVMEFVDGCDLKALLSHQQATRTIDIGLTLYLMIEAAKGLHYAHTLENPQTGKPLGIVHRDVSPPNIMLSKNGEVKVVDFGLAKAQSQVEITDEGVVKGKFSYLSPEAALGEEVDARTDVFALGIITWEMLTGKRLFYADDPHKTIGLVRAARVPSISAINPKVDPELDAIVRKALARDRGDRTPTAADYADDLANYLFSQGLKVTSRNVSNAVKAVRGAKKEPSPSQSLINALIADEIAKMTSIVDEKKDEEYAKPIEIVDTANWANDLLSSDDDDTDLLSDD
ncbi:MAG TPA: serine/threonine-protein kinase [Kofleriaceae bacterium]|nr:serine/threonine-protein kinase [Kofleriaceae bacterium]